MSKDLIAEIDRIIPRLPGWCSPEKARAMAELVVEHRPAVSVEIGVFGGRSLIASALGHEYIEHGHAYGIDPWDPAASIEGVQEKENIDWWSALNHEDIFRTCIATLLEERLTHRCTVFKTTAERAHPLVDQIDVLHIDGNHSELASTLDVFLYLPKVVPSGFIWFDDYDWNSTQNAIRMVEERCEKVKVWERTLQTSAFALYKKK